MRWYAYLETLPDADAGALVNALTAAAGYASHAVRRQGADAPTGEVLRTWDRAAGHLLRARRLLAGLPLPDATPPAAPPAAAASDIPWRQTLDAGPPGTGRGTLGLQLTAVRAIQAAALAALEDADIGEVRAHVIAAVAALADARCLAGEAAD